MTKKKEISGLTSQQAIDRLKKYGSNELKRKEEVSWLKIFLDQLRSPLIYILIFAGIVTIFLKEYTDSIVIFAAVFVNTILGFFQEAKAEKSLFLLRQMIIPHAWVVRDGSEQKVESRKLVPGDLVILKTGEKVPADGIIIDSADLHINEAILTGESEPVKKEKTKLSNGVNTKEAEDINQAFMGTVIVAGWGKMLITQTGMKTKMGKIAGGLGETIQEPTPLKSQIKKLSHVLAVVMLVICLLIFFEGLAVGRSFVEMFTISVAIAVAAIPEGLVISVTMILVLGMQRLLASKALIRKLLAAETLGSVSCICADKTGTLTEGKMRVIKSDSLDKNLLIQSAILCNNLINPLELAMYNWAEKELENKGETEKEKLLEKKRIDEIPFSSEKKYMAILYDDYLLVSGAPEKILSFCNLSSQQRKIWDEKLEKYAHSGYRIVAFAYRKKESKDNKLKKEKIEEGLLWLGLLIFEDPIRKDVGAVLKSCQKAGIKLKVITGDYCGTAVAVLNKLGIVNGQLKDENIMEGSKLQKISEEELEKIIDKIVLFCRTTPQQKIKIVEALQAKGEVVAMMGDGVNDVLALKKADIGVVVGEASEVAKETADMVLLDSNFKTILQAVKLGRATFQNIKKVVLYLLSDSFTEVILVAGSLALGLPIPLLAVQILWVNLIEDGLPGIALAFEKDDEGLLNKPPRKKDAPILDKEMKIIIFIIGFVTDLGLFAVFFILLKLSFPMDFIRTVIFVALGIDSLFYIFSCKSLHKNIWKTKFWDNMFLNISVILGLILLIGAIYLPFLQTLLHTVSLPFWAFFLLIIFAVLKVAAIEGVKSFFIEE